MPFESNYVDKTMSHYDDCTSLTGLNDDYKGLFSEKKANTLKLVAYVFVTPHCCTNRSIGIIDLIKTTATVLIKNRFIRPELSPLSTLH